MPNAFFEEDKETNEQGQISFQKEWGYEYWIKMLPITGAGSDTTASSETMIFKGHLRNIRVVLLLFSAATEFHCH